MSILNLTNSLIKIKNASMRKHKSVDIAYSKFNQIVLDKLQQIGFIHSYAVQNTKSINIILKYRGTISSIEEIKFISKPSAKYYVEKKFLDKHIQMPYITVLSTSKGILTLYEAKTHNVGGLLLFRII